jgi:ubiquinone/menaquinone biosynthesis C-methylase UbiE
VLDINGSMRDRPHQASGARCQQVRREANAEQLPFADDVSTPMHRLSIRNVPRIEAALAEGYRV